jgi:phosphoribosylglycinamide formyltransferase-1
MQNMVILISGQGSNMEALVKACESEQWPARVAAVISNRPQAPGLALAQARGITTAVVDHTAYPQRADFDHALATAIDTHQPDWVVLAGFMRVLGAAFVRRYEGHLLNIHPSLLPAFPGLHTHRRALAAGCALAGATVHFVSAELDHGPIVLQSAVPVLAGDTEATLAARVLATEHVIYPQALRRLIHGQLRLQEGRVLATDSQARWCWAGQEAA